MKGIIFSEENFHAVVAGSKTQTRRIIKPVPDDSGLHNHTARPMSLSPEYDMRGWWGDTESTSETREFKPRYKTGEILYLKEPYLLDLKSLEDVNAVYRYGNNNIVPNVIKWSNRMFMPARAARCFIKITDVRVERVQDISEEDCYSEGITGIRRDVKSDIWGYKFPGDGSTYFPTPQEAYAAEWDKINGEGSWNANPWVWVYGFELIEKWNNG